MWEFFTLIMKSHGVLALAIALETIGIVYLYRINIKRQEQLLALYRERVKDVTESKDRYAELASKLDQSIDLLIKVFKRNSD